MDDKQKCFKISKLFRIGLSFIILYIIQFLIFPNVFSRYFPTSNEASSMLLVPITLLIIFGMIFVSDKMRYWLLGDALYLVLIFIYSAGESYSGVSHYFAGNACRFCTNSFVCSGCRQILIILLILLLIYMVFVEISFKVFIKLVKWFKKIIFI